MSEHHDSCRCAKCLRKELAAAKERIAALDAENVRAKRDLAEYRDGWRVRAEQADREHRAALERVIDLVLPILEFVVLPATETCVNYDPAGSDYEVRPAESVLKAFTPLGVTEDDFGISIGAGPYRSTAYLLRGIKAVVADALRAEAQIREG